MLPGMMVMMVMDPNPLNHELQFNASFYKLPSPWCLFTAIENLDTYLGVTGWQKINNQALIQDQNKSF